eukprot:CAMPEP_0179446954 /NCGR_PEP_ID=MMETSP0799-20121207/30575_1 /TAXON_ID=46947 /ORGANISM="Geminigera cryophila, Strain CCMP2564" /LENGTH=83 /DNA_ID=CAMNT_0021236863 /DNA_START=705 /DNA_END=956 /DNA_ORIENTATION=-
MSLLPLLDLDKILAFQTEHLAVLIENHTQLAASSSRWIVPSWLLGDLLSPSTRTRITPCSWALLLSATFQLRPPTLSWRRAQV